MLLRQKPDAFYAFPDHASWFRSLLWKLGFDPLTVYERLEQVNKEREYWKERYDKDILILDYDERSPHIEEAAVVLRRDDDGRFDVVKDRHGRFL